jgi:glycosyltransferase involved in cell wall biosynthesis
MGLVLLEAMNAQVPIVASSVGGIPEVIRSGIDGVLVPPGDVSKLCEACRSVLKNPEFASSLVQSAQKRRSLFSLERMIIETEKVYFRLLE